LLGQPVQTGFKCFGASYEIDLALAIELCEFDQGAKAYPTPIRPQVGTCDVLQEVGLKIIPSSVEDGLLLRHPTREMVPRIPVLKISGV